MNQNIVSIPSEYVNKLHINGLRGRYLQVPSQSNKKTQILLIYGVHSSIERMYSLASSLSQFGTVTVPDLPGFGGMDSLYVINKKPSLEMMAEYLATFIKLHYKNKKIVICGMSYGFLVIIKMLQMHPKLSKQIIILIDLVGFSHYSDFSFSKNQYSALKNTSYIFSYYPTSLIAKYILFSKPIIYLSYKLSSKKHPKMKDANKNELKTRVRFEQYLWKCNDPRTYSFVLHDLLTVNLVNETLKNIDLNHVVVDGDQYFNNDNVLKNLKYIFNNIIVYKAKLPNHAPTVVSDEKEAGAIIPAKLRKKLAAL